LDTPSDLKYTEEHEWLRVDGDTVEIGITDYAQGELGDIVFVELPSVGDQIERGESFGTIEAVKAVSDLYAPITGKVTEINDSLEDDPTVINRDPYGDGWMIKVEISDSSEIEKLLTADAYKNTVED
jgi:glycine cleavage system H protein